MLFAGWEVRIVKNCDRGLENTTGRRRPRAAFVFFPSTQTKKTHGKNTHARVTVTVVR